MIIYRAEHNRNYLKVNNSILCDSNLSLRAKGLLCLLLSYDENKRINVDIISKDCKESVTAIRTVLNELIETGHLVRKQIHNKGRFEWIYEIYEMKNKE